MNSQKNHFKKLELESFYNSVINQESSSQKMIVGAFNRIIASNELFNLRKARIDEKIEAEKQKMEELAEMRLQEDHKQEMQLREGKSLCFLILNRFDIKK